MAAEQLHLSIGMPLFFSAVRTRQKKYIWMESVWCNISPKTPADLMKWKHLTVELQCWSKGKGVINSRVIGTHPDLSSDRENSGSSLHHNWMDFPPKYTIRVGQEDLQLYILRAMVTREPVVFHHDLHYNMVLLLNKLCFLFRYIMPYSDVWGTTSTQFRFSTNILFCETLKNHTFNGLASWHL